MLYNSYLLCYRDLCKNVRLFYLEFFNGCFNRTLFKYDGFSHLQSYTLVTLWFASFYSLPLFCLVKSRLIKSPTFFHLCTSRRISHFWWRWQTLAAAACLFNPPTPHVAYFDQQTGALHAVCWLKSFVSALKQVFPSDLRRYSYLTIWTP